GSLRHSWQVRAPAVGAGHGVRIGQTRSGSWHGGHLLSLRRPPSAREGAATRVPRRAPTSCRTTTATRSSTGGTGSPARWRDPTGSWGAKRFTTFGLSTLARRMLSEPGFSANSPVTCWLLDGASTRSSREAVFSRKLRSPSCRGVDGDLGTSTELGARLGGCLPRA